MKPIRFFTAALLMAALVLVSSCASHRGLGRQSGQSKSVKETVQNAGEKVKETAKKTGRRVGRFAKSTRDRITHRRTKANPGAAAADLQGKDFLQQVNENVQPARFITSKIKFSVESGSRQMTLTGNLKMKRDDVIRLQLMAFGFVEAARLEFTPEYVLIIDRINKVYLKVPYAHLDFMRNSGIDFYVLQSLFWNELFQPGSSKMTEAGMDKYQTEPGVDDDMVIAMENGKMSYRWLASRQTARVKMANIMYNDHFRGNYQLNWDYEDFKRQGKTMFPMKHNVSFRMPEKEVKFEMVLNYMGAEDNWETRTTLSGKYRQVEIEEILRRFMSL